MSLFFVNPLININKNETNENIIFNYEITENNEINITNIEEVENMKLTGFEKVTGSNLEFSLNNRYNGISKLGTKYYTTSRSSGTGVVYVYSIQNLTDTSTTEDTFSPGATITGFPLLRVYNSTVWYMTGTASNIYISNIGSTFATVTFSGTTANFIVDMFYDGTNVWGVGLSQYTTYSELIWFRNATTYSVATDVNTGVGAYVFLGHYNNDSQTYTTYYINSSNILKKVEIDFSTNPNGVKTVSTADSSLVVETTAPNGGIYWEQKGNKMLIDLKHIYSQTKGSDDWNFLSSTTVNNIGAIWDYDSNGDYIINFIRWGNKHFKVFSGGGLGLLEENTIMSGSSTGCGFEDWLGTGFIGPIAGDGDEFLIQHNTITERSSLTINPTSCKINHNSGVIQIRDNTGNAEIWEEGVYLEIHNDNDEYIIGCFVSKIIIDEDLQLNITAYTPAYLDMKKKITYSDTAQTETTAISEIDKFLEYVDLSISGATGTRDHSYDETTLEQIIKEIEQFHQLTHYYAPEDIQIVIDNGTNSNAITISDTNVVGGFSYRSEPFGIKSAKIFGSFLNGSRLTSFKTNTGLMNGYIYQDYFPNIKDQTTLDNLAQSIIDVEAKDLVQFNFRTFNIGLVQYGRQITFSDTRRSNINSDFNTPTLYFVNDVIYELITDESQIFCSDSLIFKINKDEQKTTPENNETLITQINEETAGVQGFDTQTTITDSDSHLPTSGAVVDYVAANSGNPDYIVAGLYYAYNGFVLNGYYGAAYYVSNSDSAANIEFNMIVQGSGTFKLRAWITRLDTNGGTVSITWYARTASPWDKINGDSTSITFSSTAGTPVAADSDDSFTANDGDIILGNMLKGASSQTAGNMYVFSIMLVRQ